jgi:hypothetical protein
MEANVLKNEEELHSETERNVSRWQEFQSLIKDQITINDISITIKI